MNALERLLEKYVNNYSYDIKALRDEYCQCGDEDYYKFIKIYEEELSSWGEE